MEKLVSRAGLWFVITIVAVMAVAAAKDSGFAIHMSIVALAALIALWVNVSGADYSAIAKGILQDAR